MKKSQLNQIIREEITKALNQKYQAVFNDISDNDIPVSQLFDSEQEARKWADDLEWDNQEEVYIDNDYKFITKYYYFNPETKESYNTGYTIVPVEAKIDETEGPYDLATARLNKAVGVRPGEGKANVMKYDLNKLPGYDRLPDSDVNWKIKMFLPSVDTGDAYTYLYTKKMVKKWVDDFKKKWNESPQFDITGDKIKVTNPDYVKWKDEYNKLRSNVE